MHIKRVLTLAVLAAMTLTALAALLIALVPVQAAPEQETAVLTDSHSAQSPAQVNETTTFVAFLSGD